MTELVIGLLALGLGLALGYYVLARPGFAAQVRAVQEELAESRLEREQQAAHALELEKAAADLKARLEESMKRLAEEREQAASSTQQLREAFQSLSREALRQSNEEFLHLAGQRFAVLRTEASGELEQRQQAVAALVAPLQEQLKAYQLGLQELEGKRLSAYTSLSDHLQRLAQTETDLQQETGKLVDALRRPQVRGRWGEMQLRNAVEIAGMSEYCDFTEQVQVAAGSGVQRPDLIVRLPGGRCLVVDSKVPLDAYLSAFETQDSDERAAHLQRHSEQCRRHLDSLSKKEYWAQFDTTPDCVVMYIPGESLFAAALEADKDLLSRGLRQRVIPTTPSTFIALLHAVSYGWRQQHFTEHAEQIRQQAGELYERMRVFVEHFGKVGKSLNSSVEAYNSAVGSLEQRLVPTARRLSEMGIKGKKEFPEATALDSHPRTLSPGTLAELPPAEDEVE